MHRQPLGQVCWLHSADCLSGESRRLRLQTPAVKSKTYKGIQEAARKTQELLKTVSGCLERQTGNGRTSSPKWLQEGHATFLRLSFPICNLDRLIQGHEEGP